MKAGGADLALRLQREAVGLAYSKATEFSPRIEQYFLLAAKVALLVYWPDNKALGAFEKDVYYYRNFEATRYLVEEYENFKEAFTGCRSS